MDMDNRTTRRRRTRLVDELVSRDVIGDEAVARAMRTVARHVFVPEINPAHAYDDEVVVTKSDVSGRPVSSCSQPAMVAIQLEQLAVRPGDRILEIGAGTGYNAALLAELAGTDGAVFTVDLDDDIVDRARRGLSAAGYRDVTVVRGDGELGWAAGAPYDRIIATVGVGDVPSAWWDQLAPGGRVCVPLAFRGMQRSLGLAERFGRLSSDSVTTCGFIPVRGIGAFTGRTEPLPTGARLYRDADQPAAGNLTDVLTSTPEEWWLAEPLRPFDRIDSLELMLATTFPGFRKLIAGSDGGPEAAITGDGAVVDGDSFAWLARRSARPGVSLGIKACGPGRDVLISRLREVITTWDREFRQKEYRPVVMLTRKPGEPPPSTVVVEKPHTWLTFSDA